MKARELLNKTSRYLYFVFLVLLMNPIDLFCQEEPKKIEILNANSLEYNKKVNPNVRRFIGNVIFEHNESVMYCDSAYSYTNQNRIDAFGNVHIERGDSLHVYGDFLSYNGNANFGKLRQNVKLEDPEAQVLTDSLDFYTEKDYAYYFNGGKIISEDKTITSKTGHYYSDEKMAYFKTNVKVVSPDYTVEADTLNYDTKNEIAYFDGPTNIYSDTSRLYCENGWYKTTTNEFLFTKNARYQKKERILKGDTLYYNDPEGLGVIRKNAEIIDTSRNIILRGHYSEYTEEPAEAFLTDSALMIQVDKEKDSLFLHADTLKSHYDSTETYRIFKAYFKVKFFKTNLQGKCDSLAYNLQDSTIRMYYNPVIWSDSNQIYADFVTIYLKDDEVNRFNLENNSFIVSRQADNKFNQIKGKNMIGYVENNKIQQVDVEGNGQTIYYTKDKNEIVGVNKALCSNLIIKLRDNEVTRINMVKSPEGILYPLGNLKETRLDGFKWLEKERPLSKDDIYIWNNK
jgi:lipopolysaccharide export system protein LptA